MEWGSVQHPLSLWNYTELLEDLEKAGLKESVEAKLERSIKDEEWEETFGNYASLSGYVEVRKHLF